MIKPEDLTTEMIAGYFGEHCECRPLDIERTSHSHDCDDDLCEDARVALGGRPNGCGYRSTVETFIHTQAAKRRIYDDIIEEGSDPAVLAALGKQLLDEAARFKANQETSCVLGSDSTALNADANQSVPPSLTPEQGAVLGRCFRIGFGELQARVARGDEDDHLAKMIDAFDAYFVVCRAKLGHDRVPIMAWETYTVIKRRHALVEGGSHG